MNGPESFVKAKVTRQAGSCAESQFCNQRGGSVILPAILEDYTFYPVNRALTLDSDDAEARQYQLQLAACLECLSRLHPSSNNFHAQTSVAETPQNTRQAKTTLKPRSNPLPEHRARFNPEAHVKTMKKAFLKIAKPHQFHGKPPNTFLEEPRSQNHAAAVLKACDQLRGKETAWNQTTGQPTAPNQTKRSAARLRLLGYGLALTLILFWNSKAL